MRLESRNLRASSENAFEGVPEDLFPLPLTPFELFMVLDDRPELPMVFSVELGFQGNLDPGVFEEAVGDAIQRHPLLRAHIRWNGKLPEWIPAEGPPSPIRWLDHSPDADGVAPIDLKREPGIRVEAMQGDNGSTVWLRLHHACCDGLGARRFIVDLLTGYCRRFPEQLPMPLWDILDYEALKRRHNIEAKAMIGKPPPIWVKMREAFHFLCLKPQPLHTATLTEPRTARPVYAKHRFDVSETTSFREQARECGTSLNDVAMALLFRTLVDWNRRHGHAPEGQRLRVLMPTDLRSTPDDRMPAANRMSFSFVARTIAECENWSELASGIRNETQYFKQVQIGLDFLAGITMAQRFPRLFRHLLNRRSCMATAVLTNLGDPTKRFRRRVANDEGAPVIGNTVLRKVYGTPPIRPMTHAAFGLCVCSRQLCVSMLANSAVVGDDGTGLLQLYVNHWRRWSTSRFEQGDDSP